MTWRDSDTAPMIRLFFVGAIFAAFVVAVGTWSTIRINRPGIANRSLVESPLAVRALELSDPEKRSERQLVRASLNERDLHARVGFDIELVYRVPPEQGSWVCLAVDHAGRLIASDQSSGLFRITPGPDASATVVESFASPVGAAQGLLCIDDSLYCVVAGDRADGPGLYRLRDTDGDDSYDDWRRLRPLSSGGEHGPHGIVLGPDDMLYIVAGNHTPLPDPERSVVPRVWAEDLLLPRLWDARGHAVGILAPGGWICRTDRDGKTWELFASGFRNPYDLAFNAHGELFTFDADMEWDMGAPWYRPTRINHVVSGAEFGWRSGTGKWPEHWIDSLPATLDVGPGSPTGICFGYGTQFPERYQNALFAADWTFGTIYAIHLEQNGTTYRADLEPFVTGRPLPVTDVVANPVDGALYFAVGGRGVESALYRVKSDEAHDSKSNLIAREDQTGVALRHQLERLHTRGESPAVNDMIWPHLGSRERFIRYAARIALEHQPPAWWRDRALGEVDPRACINAIVALVRHDQQVSIVDVASALESCNEHAFDQQERLDWLRAWSLCFSRLGPPDEVMRHRLANRFGEEYPTGVDTVDRELCDLLVFLRSPSVVERTIPLMERSSEDLHSVDFELIARNETYGSAIVKMAAAMPQRAQVHYALTLSHAEAGWTPALRARYFNWFRDAREARGGLSFSGFLDEIRSNALRSVPERERERYISMSESSVTGLDELPQPAGPGRSWTVDEVLDALEESPGTRDFENGKNMYVGAMCSLCHRFSGIGQPGGPDLTQVATRHTVRDLVRTIVEPNASISDQYEQTRFSLSDGSVVIGRVVSRNPETIEVMQSMLLPRSTITLEVGNIVSEAPSSQSAMMPGLLNRLNAAEVCDLIAFLQSEGDPRHPLFTPGETD